MSTPHTVPHRSPILNDTVGDVLDTDSSLWPSRSLVLPGKGELLAEYVVQEKLGEGGMGVVLKAWDPDLRRPIAIKLLRPETYSQGDTGRKRLIREAQAMARICHENVVTIYHIGTFTGRVFIAMEFVDGGTLRTWLESDKPSIDAIIQRWTLAGQGLVAAHAEGLVHRDFKPDNVLVTANGRVLVTDFGLVTTSIPQEPDDSHSEAIGLSMGRTEHGLIMGTPVYMAPEQHEGLSIDARVDQFSFCVSLYEALYEVRPFPETSYPLMVRAILRGEVLPAPNDTAVPGKVRSLLLRGLSANPADRFASMQDLLDELAGRKLVVLPTLTQPIHRDRVSQLCILERSGRLQQALAMSEELSESIANTQDSLTKAQYHLSSGRIHTGFKNYDLAIDSFRDSVSAAVNAEEPEIEAEAFSRMVAVLAWQKRLTEAELMTLAASSASRRADTPEQRARYEIALSTLDYQS
ncbi:MAG: serine/threonine protein kinase, partial [Kofleriaceae bacterium]|nr:serine/threonine protein kinase [Kofleriaceae bacterium]